MIENLHRAAEPLIFGRAVDRHDRLDGVAVEGSVEALAAAQAAHRVKIEGGVDAGLLELRQKEIKPVEFLRGDFRICPAPPEIVPFVFGDGHINMMKAHRIPAPADEVLDHPFTLFFGKEVRVKAKIAADEPDRRRALLEGDMPVLGNLGKTVFSGRSITQGKRTEIKDGPRLDMIGIRENAPVRAGGQFDRRRRQIQRDPSWRLLERIGENSLNLELDDRLHLILRPREFNPELQARLLFLAHIGYNRITRHNRKVKFFRAVF